jgi:hypothetical protein
LFHCLTLDTIQACYLKKALSQNDLFPMSAETIEHGYEIQFSFQKLNQQQMLEMYTTTVWLFNLCYVSVSVWVYEYFLWIYIYIDYLRWGLKLFFYKEVFFKEKENKDKNVLYIQSIHHNTINTACEQFNQVFVVWLGKKKIQLNEINQQ